MQEEVSFQSTSFEKSTFDIIRDITSGRVYLDPAYQREGTIWSKSNKMAFINSVCIGIVPSRIIYNINEQGIRCAIMV